MKSLRNKSKAQVSMEYITIVGFVMVLLIPLLVIFYDFRTESTDLIVSNQIMQVGNKIIDSAESIYFLGEPSKTILRVYLPNKIQTVEIGNNELVFNVSTRAGIDQVVFLSDVNITGSIPNTNGVHNVQIESMGTYVEISTN